MNKVDVKIFAKTIEDEAVNQIMAMARVPIGEGQKIRIMPDAHAGKGCTVGTTMTIGDKVCPNLVGVDIGCGVLGFQLNQRIGEEERRALLTWLENGGVPSGRNVWMVEDLQNESKVISKWWKMGAYYIHHLHCYEKLEGLDYLWCSLGTLGSGNHFISIERDSKGYDWILIHSGSRNLGKQVAEYYQNLATQSLKAQDIADRQAIIDMWKDTDPTRISAALAQFQRRAATGLEYLIGEDMQNYLDDMDDCTTWAHYNRYVIGMAILQFLGRDETDVYGTVESVHNYIEKHDGQYILRKGAISAYDGEDVLIPLNMRDGTLLGVGQGDLDWNQSAPHGAGRLMSRHAARERLDLGEFQRTMAGIDSNPCEATIDEAPDAYKNWEEIATLIQPTVDIVDHLYPVMNFKAIT